MSVVATLIRFGWDNRAADDVALPAHVLLLDMPVPLTQIRSNDLLRILAESTADWILLADRTVAVETESLKQLLTSCQSDESATFVLSPASSVPEINNCWKQLPPRLAVMLTPPEYHAVVAVRKSPEAETALSRDVDQPLWHALIEAAATDGRLAVTSTGMSVERPLPREAVPLPALVPAAASASPEWLRGKLAQFEVAEVTPEIGSPEDAVALKAGLLQLHDLLDASHDLSQTVQGDGRHQAGDYWHAIMHRREPDYSNAKYWFRRVGRHPIFDALAEKSADILGRCESPSASDWASRLQAANGWEPFAFVDLCEECSRSSDASLTRAAEEIQFAEMLLLIEQTYRDACG